MYFCFCCENRSACFFQCLGVKCVKSACEESEEIGRRKEAKRKSRKRIVVKVGWVGKVAGQYRQQQQAVRIDCQRINVLHTGTKAAVGRGGGGGDGSRVGRKNGALLHQSATAGTAGESPRVLLCLATLEPKYLPAHLWWIAVLLRTRTSNGSAAARGAGSNRNRTGRIPPSGVVVRVPRRRRSYRSGCSLHGTNDKVWATVYRLYAT